MTSLRALTAAALIAALATPAAAHHKDSHGGGGGTSTAPGQLAKDNPDADPNGDGKTNGKDYAPGQNKDAGEAG